MTRVRGALAIISTLVLVGIPATVVANDSTFTIASPVQASGSDPFAACTDGSSGGGSVYPGTTVEPQVAVNPTDSSNIIGVFQQDRWTNGGSKGLVASYSTNGGTSWSLSWPEFSTCADDSGTAYTPPFNRSTDPWISFDSAGKAYFISLGVDSADLNHSDVEVATSTDGGATWSLPSQLTVSTNPIKFNDKESITADWRSTVGAGKAYATWIQGNLPGVDNISPVGAANSFAYSGLPMFSKTTDGGATWSTPVPMTNQIIYMQGNQIVVLPDGTLVDVGAVLFKGSGIQPTPQQYFWAALVSKNGGKTWGAPIKIAPLGTVLLTNPDIPEPTSLDQTVRAGDYIPDVAVDHSSGAIYMVFADGISTGFDHVKLTKSTDGGKSWTVPVDVTGTPSSTHSFNGTVEVAGDGTLAVMYYDFRNNDSNPGLPTDVWLRHSHDGGASWSADQHVYAPGPSSFDMENAPVSRGWFLGDYHGMAALGGTDLELFFAVSTGSNDSAVVESVKATQ